MKSSSFAVKSIVVLAVTGLFFLRPAHAYLDPGTGSMIFQMLAAAILGSVVTIGIYWDKFKSFLLGLGLGFLLGRSQRSSSETEEDEEE